MPQKAFLSTHGHTKGTKFMGTTVNRTTEKVEASYSRFNSQGKGKRFQLSVAYQLFIYLFFLQDSAYRLFLLFTLHERLKGLLPYFK